VSKGDKSPPALKGQLVHRLRVLVKFHVRETNSTFWEATASSAGGSNLHRSAHALLQNRSCLAPPDEVRWSKHRWPRPRKAVNNIHCAVYIYAHDALLESPEPCPL
jgi:hypothetical protein